MLLHEKDHIVNQVSPALIDLKMLFIIDKQSEIMVQAHAGEGEVINAIT
jgi:hypothetical protein